MGRDAKVQTNKRLERLQRQRQELQVQLEQAVGRVNELRGAIAFCEHEIAEAQPLRHDES